MSNLALTAANIVKWVAWGPTKIQAIHGMNNQGAILYIQFHEVPPLAGQVTLTAGAIPAYKSLQVAANTPFYFALNSTLKECLYVVSTTELTYTAVAANGGLDATLEYDAGPFTCDGTEVVIGDRTSNVTGLTMWADSAGVSPNNTLLRLDVTDTGGADTFVCLAPTVATATVSVLPQSIVFLPANGTLSLQYGESGLNEFQKSTVANPPVIQNGGCVKILLATAGYPTIPLTTGGQATIRAIYKPC